MVSVPKRFVKMKTELMLYLFSLRPVYSSLNIPCCRHSPYNYDIPKQTRCSRSPTVVAPLRYTPSQMVPPLLPEPRVLLATSNNCMVEV